MIELDILSADGEVPNPPVRVRFAESGGMIGRAPGNDLRLPDPQRTVSRVHAQIVRRQGVVIVVARSANGLIVDGVPVAFGDEVPLADGATLLIGSYAIRASLSGTRRASEPDHTTIRG